jgi:hypothetical protein
MTTAQGWEANPVLHIDSSAQPRPMDVLARLYNVTWAEANQAKEALMLAVGRNTPSPTWAVGAKVLWFDSTTPLSDSATLAEIQEVILAEDRLVLRAVDEPSRVWSASYEEVDPWREEL